MTPTSHALQGALQHVEIPCPKCPCANTTVSVTVFPHYTLAYVRCFRCDYAAVLVDEQRQR